MKLIIRYDRTSTNTFSYVYPQFLCHKPIDVDRDVFVVASSVRESEMQSAVVVDKVYADSYITAYNSAAKDWIASAQPAK